jgi:hypothetical protein
MHCHGGERKSERVCDQFVGVAQRRVGDDLAFPGRQPGVTGGGGIVASCEHVAAPLAVEVVRDRPASRHQALPDGDGFLGIPAAQPAAGAVQGDDRLAERCPRGDRGGRRLGMLDSAVRVKHGLHALRVVCPGEIGELAPDAESGREVRCDPAP